jgi:hypothetical protein
MRRRSPADGRRRRFEIVEETRRSPLLSPKMTKQHGSAGAAVLAERFGFMNGQPLARCVRRNLCAWRTGFSRARSWRRLAPSPRRAVSYENECEHSRCVCERARYVPELQLRAPIKVPIMRHHPLRSEAPGCGGGMCRRVISNISFKFGPRIPVWLVRLWARPSQK